MNERSIEYEYVFRQITNFAPKTICDIGAGLGALPRMYANCMLKVMATDSNPYAVKANRHFKVHLDNILKPKIKGKYDMVTCVSVLEHIKDHYLAVNNMASMLNNDGHLVMTFPYNETKYIENAYKLPEAGYRWGNNVCRQYCMQNLLEYEKFGLKLIDINRWQIFDGAYWTYGKRLNKPKSSRPDELHHLACIAFQKDIK